MAGKDKKVKVYTPSRERNSVPPKKSTPHRKFRFFLVALQAFCGAFIGVCFFLYNTYSSVSSLEDGSYDKNATFFDVSRDYFESDIYTDNLDYATSNILRFVAIREQMEESGEFKSDKVIDVGEYANRFFEEKYVGPSVKYYLGDLLKWGQKAASESFSFCTYEFYTAKEYCDFFNIDYNTLNLPEGYKDSEPYISFETLKDLYTTTNGDNAQNYARNEKEYQEIVSNITKTVTDLYSNYLEYLNYKSLYSEEESNIRYYVHFTRNNRKYFYTNVREFSDGILTDKVVDERFKKYGEYISACPGKMEFVTNTKVPYDTIKKAVMEDYAYSFEDDTKIWIAVDTTFPSEDVFYLNKISFEKTAKLIPWIVSLGALAFVMFIGLFVYIWFKDKVFFSTEGTKENLGAFDKLPIEISVLFVVLLGLIFYIGETQVFVRFYVPNSKKIYFFIPAISFLFVDLYIALLFIYGFGRRFICKNLFEGSILSILLPKVTGSNSRIRKWFLRVYESSGVAIRTMAAYVLFLLFNCFWVCLMFFSSYKIVSFLVLFVFDASVGIVLFNRNYERKNIVDGINQISRGNYNYKIDETKMHGDNKTLASGVNEIRSGLSKALEISTKDEKLKADLITNVSHDIKTPLTSIINYVDLLKRENIEDERVQKYINVLDEKSQRLKQLTYDLLEASKVASGNISIDLIKIDAVEFLKQAVGEFEDKFSEKGLELVMNVPSEPVFAMVDPRHMWRVVENILNNVYKYALENSRVYLDLIKVEEEGKGDKLVLSLKNISKQQLNIPADELTERFIRGDVSRSTEGSGLGLSIAKNLTAAQNGVFDIYLDGDLFKVTITLNAEK